MKILFVTDLHGDERKYELAYQIAEYEKVDAVINGGDMLPYCGNMYESESNFLYNYLQDHFRKYAEAGIYYIAILGNDDLAVFDKFFEALCSQSEYICNIAQKKINVKGYDFIGFNLVCDYPFRLKDRCRMDDKDFEFPPQFGSAIFTDKEPGSMTIEEWFEYAKKIPTIAQELRNLPKPADYNKAIYVMHMPPSGSGMDICADRRRVGSKAIKRFIEERQPLLSLHGHIHESPTVTGIWENTLGRAHIIQPGSYDRHLAYVIIEILETGVISSKRYMQI